MQDDIPGMGRDAFTKPRSGLMDGFTGSVGVDMSRLELEDRAKSRAMVCPLHSQPALSPLSPVVVAAAQIFLQTEGTFTCSSRPVP